MKLFTLAVSAAALAGVAFLCLSSARAGDPPVSAPVVKLGNKTCPVKGTPVDPKITVLWNGFEISCCCPECPKKFIANPNAYTPALLRDLAAQLAEAKAQIAGDKKPSGAGGSSDAASIQAELKSELAEAKEHLAAKHLDKLHEPAAHIWGLAAKLRDAKAPYGRLFKLARDLDEQGDSGNASGAAECIASLEKEIAKPSADLPDTGKPLTAEEHEGK